MEMLIVVILAVIVAFSLGRGRAATPQIIYVQTEPIEARGMGCLPIFIVGAVVLLALGIVRF